VDFEGIVRACCCQERRSISRGRRDERGRTGLIDHIIVGCVDDDIDDYINGRINGGTHDDIDDGVDGGTDSSLEGGIDIETLLNDVSVYDGESLSLDSLSHQSMKSTNFSITPRRCYGRGRLLICRGGKRPRGICRWR